MTSAGHWLARTHSTTDRSVAGMRALSLYAGITMLYLGYCTNDVHSFPGRCRRHTGKTLVMITRPAARNAPARREMPAAHPARLQFGRGFDGRIGNFLNSMC